MTINTEYIYNKLKEIINVEITPSDYTFIETNKELSNIILMGLGGSYAYGTNIEGSDIDLRGIALNSRENILLGKDFEQVVNTDTDTTIYSLNKISSLFVRFELNQYLNHHHIQRIQIFQLKNSQKQGITSLFLINFLYNY